MKIAFIGLGNMGGGMAANLVKAGHEVRAFDLNEAALAAAREAGCATFATAREACATVEAVVSMLPNGAIVKQVYWDDVIGHAPKGATLLDCSTIDVATAREVIAVTERHGYQMVDAPVSEAFARAQPILAAMGKAVIHAGDAGNGQAAKICNNMLLAIHMIGTCEAFAMADKLGLDAQTFYDISSVSSGQNWSMTSYCPVPGVGPVTPADNDYQGGFAAGLMLKDLRLAMEAAAGAGATVALGEHARAIYEAFAKDNAGVDFSGVIRTL
jgi:3-hydroxyisobutyrate dehydrogenase